MEIQHDDLDMAILEPAVTKLVDLEPKVGKIFESKEDVLECYKKYAASKGFGVVTLWSKKKSQYENVTYGCHRSGKPKTVASNPVKPNLTTKTDCKARMNIASQVDGKWKVNSIILDHNHDMDPDSAKYLRCNRNLPSHVKRKIELDEATGIRMKKIATSCVIEAEGHDNVTWIEGGARNHLDKVMRLELKEGDAEAMQQYFERMQKDNGNFFYLIDVDGENRVRNVFWADARSRECYKEFGDVVTFDTTYLVNRYDMPFVFFVGVNHHGQLILFGCGLVLREDTESFIWLFKTWLSCMSGCHPNAIITDQCKAMQKAIGQVFPNTRHRWCLWHIIKKIPDKLKGYTLYVHIKGRLKTIVYDSLTPSEFEENWAGLIEAYNLQDNDWLRGLYEERHRWVPAFLKDTFWAGMSTTQRSESINTFFDGYVRSKTTLKEFVAQYDNILREKVEKEEEEDARCTNMQLPVISPYKWEEQFQNAYTLTKFKQLRDEFAEQIGCSLYFGPVVDGISEFKIEHETLVGKKQSYEHYTLFVHFNEKSNETKCKCQMFESEGIVCTHMISVWKLKRLEEVPKKYILRRWTKNLVRSYTNVRVSYVNWQNKPEWLRFDKLQKLFHIAAEKAMYSDVKAARFVTKLIEGIEELENSDEECASNSPMPIKCPENQNERLSTQ